MLGLFKRKKETPPLVSAVIVAAGSASRMGGIDKLKIPLGEMPVAAWSILAFCASPQISEIVVVCRDDDIPDYYYMIQDFELDKVSKVVAGGESRQDSVYAGINACGQDTAYFAIHDGARPLISPALIDNCINAAIEFDAAALGVPVKDTIKIANRDGYIESTPNRASLWAIQTPQIFEAKAFRAAIHQAKHSGHSFTDDCQLMERTGKKVFIAEGSYENIKITTPEDIILARAILEYRENGPDMF